MLNRYSAKPLLCMLLGSVCFGLSPVYSAGYNNDETNPYQEARRYEEEEVRKYPLYHIRRGDWDNYQNWHYDRDAYFRGETQGEAYRREHPFGPAGVGYDADENYLREKQRRAHHHYGDRPNVSNSQTRRNGNQSNNGNNGSYAQANRNGNQSNNRSNGTYAQANRNGNQSNNGNNGSYAQANRNGNQTNNYTQPSRNGQQQPNSNQGNKYAINRYDSNRPSNDNREISANTDRDNRRNDGYNKPGVFGYDSPDDRFNKPERSSDSNKR